MPAISPSASTPPVANDRGTALPVELREQVRRLERAHSAQRAGQAAMPLGLPAIDALLPDGGLLTGALHEVEAGPAPSGRVAAHDGAALGFAAFLLSRFARGALLWGRPPPGGVDGRPDAPALSAGVAPAGPPTGTA